MLSASYVLFVNMDWRMFMVYSSFHSLQFQFCTGVSFIIKEQQHCIQNKLLVIKVY